MAAMYIVFDTQMITEEASQPAHLQRKDFVSFVYIVFDTQMIIEEASQPAHLQRKDFVSHALELLIDFVAVFVRLVIILMRHADKSKRPQNNNRRDDRRDR
ncbi:hypothetical protein T484DRAFT_1834450 [Baffinella frigidus]|nr:hypothetical protein T484DRAFT_1834450 [Cryptophyta sp. CCMP2293]